MGRHAEALAARYLVRSGMKLVQKNFHCPMGEIDLIMLDQDAIVFVEVKYRSNKRFGHGMEFVDQRKQRKLRNTALVYLQRHPRYASLAQRFDVIDVAPKSSPAAPNNMEINWLKNALQMDW